MSGKRRMVIIGACGVVAVVVGVVLSATLTRTKEVKTLVGAVLRNDPDPRDQLPVPDAKITVAGAPSTEVFRSDATGRFEVHLPPGVRPGDMVTLKFQHPDYEDLTITRSAGDQIYIVHMAPVHRERTRKQDKTPVIVSDIRVRYTAKVTTTTNVGSAVKTFQVVNTGNVPCGDAPACSPDGKWRAAVGGTSLDAGDGNTFRNARVSCIAGPCPFTRIVNDNYSRGGRIISVSVLNWSDTTTFLMEAEVVRTMPSETVRYLYPVKFGRSMNFTLPASGQGPSIEAEMNGEPIVFPLGPKLILSWADCRLEVAQDYTKMYRCDLKDGYDFHPQQR